MNKTFLFLLALIGFLGFLPGESLGQACPGSTAAMSVENGTRVSADIIDFDVWFHNTNGTIPIKTSGINGATIGIGSSAVLGTFSLIDAPQPPAPTGALTLSAPAISGQRAMRIVQTPTGEAASSTMPTVSTKFGRFRFTRTGGDALPTGDITLTWVTTGAAVPGIVGYCNGNPNSALYNLANGNLTATGGIIMGLLPVELTSLTATERGPVNLIAWSTASELNSQYHIVERSADGIANWTEVGRKLAAGTTEAEQDYSLEDERPLPMSYYRLKLLDFDGQYEYSKVVSVERKLEDFGVVNVFPMPTSDKVTMQVSLPEHSNLTVSVTDVVGRLLQVSEMEIEKGLAEIQVDLTRFAAGTYFVKLNNGIEQLTEQVVKQ